MAATPQFGFAYYGGTIPGAITDNGSQFTNEDRLFLDRALKALETADRHQLPDPPALANIPTLALSETGGSLPGGQILSYRIGLVGLDGFERAASAEVSIATPPILSPPDAPTLRDGTGTLATGLYYYALTAKGADQESVLSPAITISVIADTGGVYIDAPADTQGVALQIWRRKDTESGWSRISLIAASGTYLDDGSVAADPCSCDPGKQPPSINRGTASAAVTITLTGDALAAAQTNTIKSWRIYRTNVPGYYGSTSLVHDVVEYDTLDGSAGPLLTSWVDDGTSLVNGSPSLGNRVLRPTPYVIQTGDSVPALPANYAAGYPFFDGTALHVATGTDWARIGPRIGGHLLFGAGAPIATDGAAGDFWLHTGDGPVLYGPKGADDTWPLVGAVSRPALLNGSGAPTASTGQAGDFWLRTGDSPALYGPKTAGGAWPSSPIDLGGTSTAAGTGSAVLTSPNGSRYRLTVADDGTLSTVATLEPGTPAQPQNITATQEQS